MRKTAVRPCAIILVLEAEETDRFAKEVGCDPNYAITVIFRLLAFLRRRRSARFSMTAALVGSLALPPSFTGEALAVWLKKSGWIVEHHARDGHPYYEFQRWGELFPEDRKRENKRRLQQGYRDRKAAAKADGRALTGIPKIPPMREPTKVEMIAALERDGFTIGHSHPDDRFDD